MTREGWGPVYSANTGRYAGKVHYFRGGRSLCRRYMLFTDAGLGGDYHPTNYCAGCDRVRQCEQNPPARRRRGSYTGGS